MGGVKAKTREEHESKAKLSKTLLQQNVSLFYPYLTIFDLRTI